jgi:hypothetical protein
MWTNQQRARRRSDGSVKIVVAHANPGLPDATWVDTEGHREGFMTLRWLLGGDPPVPRTRVVWFADIARG